MHAAHLPPRHLWRSAALAALLALAFMALLSMAASRLSSDGGSGGSAPQVQRVLPQPAPLAPQPPAVDARSLFEPLATPAPLVEASRTGR